MTFEETRKDQLRSLRSAYARLDARWDRLDAQATPTALQEQQSLSLEMAEIEKEIHLLENLTPDETNGNESNT